MTPAQIAESFLKVYVETFSTSREKLAAVYEDASTMTFEGTTLKGKAAIGGAVAKIPIPLGKAHRLVTTDLQPSPSAGAVLVMVTGDIADNKFQQVFQLVPNGSGSFYIHNDIFRAGTANADNCPKELGGETAKAFVQAYYTCFDGADRAKVATLYRATSMLTFEDKTYTGPEAIVGRLKELPDVKHQIQTIDLQQVSGDTTVLLVFVTGVLSIDGSNPLKFVQAFQLISDGAGSYYVHNDLFRLNYG